MQLCPGVTRRRIRILEEPHALQAEPRHMLVEAPRAEACRRVTRRAESREDRLLALWETPPECDRRRSVIESRVWTRLPLSHLDLLGTN